MTPLTAVTTMMVAAIAMVTTVLLATILTAGTVTTCDETLYTDSNTGNVETAEVCHTVTKEPWGW